MKLTKVALILALIPCSGLIACARQAAQEEAADMQAITAAMADVESAWKQGYDRGDAAAVASLYAEDAIYLEPYRDVVRGRSAIEARLAELMGRTTARQVTIERTDAGAAGDLAYGIGTFALEMRMQGAREPMRDNGKYVTIAKRGTDGAWKILAHIWNTSLAEADVVQMLSAMSATGNR